MKLSNFKWARYQEVILQECSDQIPAGHIPRVLTVQLRDSVTQSCVPGDIVSLSGTFLRGVSSRLLPSNAVHGSESPPRRAHYGHLLLRAPRAPSQLGGGHRAAPAAHRARGFAESCEARRRRSYACALQAGAVAAQCGQSPVSATWLLRTVKPSGTSNCRESSYAPHAKCVMIKYSSQRKGARHKRTPFRYFPP